MTNSDIESTILSKFKV